jgi:hypothetical protein
MSRRATLGIAGITFPGGTSLHREQCANQAPIAYQSVLSAHADVVPYTLCPPSIWISEPEI